MKEIKFSSDYKKLPENPWGTVAKLINVIDIDINWVKQVMPEFILYDTAFRGKENFYPLRFPYGIVLTFLHLPTNTLFTTIRPHTPEKQNYYINSMGERFMIVRA